MSDIHALIQKYSTAGPRYTSYPTAPFFHAGFGNADWREEIAASQNAARGISLYVHIPFCDTLCYYCGCNMVATGKYEKVAPYLDCLYREMDAVAALCDPARQLAQLHWGGGTPTYLKPDDIRRLMEAIGKRWKLAPDAQISVEADPRELSREHLVALRESGFNRISFGVQDLDPLVQAAINRMQSPALIERVHGWARELGFRSINMDLIIGLPHQNVARFSKTLDAVIGWAPDRLAVFAYAHVPWMKKHQKLIRESDLPDLSTRIALGEAVFSRLSAAGYVDIGLDHYAKPDDELVLAQRNKTLWRNFQGYTTHRDCDIYAFGASSISQTANAYAQNEKNLRAWQGGVTQDGLSVERGVRLTPDDKLRREVITRIMCDLELDYASLPDIEFANYFANALPRLQALADDGLIELHPQRLKVTPVGRRLLRNIAMCFDAYLTQDAPGQLRYSRTV